MKFADSSSEGENDIGNKLTGIIATLGITASSGFASAHTEKVIKANRKNNAINQDQGGGEFGLAHMQAQLALVSLGLLAPYAMFRDYEHIVKHGFFYNYNAAALFSSFNSAL